MLGLVGNGFFLMGKFYFFPFVVGGEIYDALPRSIQKNKGCFSKGLLGFCGFL
jgi:hypothetical protein